MQTPSLAAPASPRRIERVRHELLRRALTVSAIQRLSPGFVAVTLTGDTLDRFVSLSFDDHLKLLLEDGSGGVQRRDFTPRSFDLQRRELTLEFALHAKGPASEWARQARVGDRAEIGGPRGSMVIPLDYDWHLLVGDASALPAIHRRLEELPAGARALVIAQVQDPADQRAFQSQARVDLQWVHSDAALLAALRALPLPAGEGFAWAAGEASVIARLRAILLEEKRLPLHATRISSYWKRGAADFHESH